MRVGCVESQRSEWPLHEEWAAQVVSSIPN
jgi:hypothetical protein